MCLLCSYVSAMVPVNVSVLCSYVSAAVPVNVSVLCSYVSAMVPVKTMKEYELLQDLTVLFCETVDRFIACSASVLLIQKVY